jgi:hypothetical protein
MSMRISDRITALALVGAASGCGGSPPQEQISEAARVPCHTLEASDVELTCAMRWEGKAGQSASHLVITHPDGSFRRFVVSDGGKSIEAADGAEPAITFGPDNGKIIVQVGQYRYRVRIGQLKR